MSQRLFLIGDSDKAIVYANYAKGKLRLMKEQMSRLKLPEMSATYRIDDVIVTVSSSYGQDTLYISTLEKIYYIMAYVGAFTYNFDNKKVYKLIGNRLKEIKEKDIVEYVLQEDGSYHQVADNILVGDEARNPLNYVYSHNTGLGIINPNNGITYKYTLAGSYHYILTTQWERELFFDLFDNTTDAYYIRSKLNLLTSPLTFETQGTGLKIYEDKEKFKILVNTSIVKSLNTNVNIIETEGIFVDNIRALAVVPSDIAIYEFDKKTLKNNKVVPKKKYTKKIDNFLDNRLILGFDKNLNIYQYLMYCREATSFFKNKTTEMPEFSLSPKEVKNCYVDIGVIAKPNFTYSVTINNTTVTYTSSEFDTSKDIIQNLENAINDIEGIDAYGFYYNTCEPFLSVYASPNYITTNDYNPSISVSDNIYIIGANVTFNMSKYKCFTLDGSDKISSTGISTIKPNVKLPFYADGKIYDYVEVNRITDNSGFISKMKYSVYCNSKLVDEEKFTPITITDDVYYTYKPLHILKYKYLILHTYHSNTFNFILFAKSRYNSHNIIADDDRFFWFGWYKKANKFSVLEVENILDYYVWVNGILYKIASKEDKIPCPLYRVYDINDIDDNNRLKKIIENPCNIFKENEKNLDKGIKTVKDTKGLIRFWDYTIFAGEEVDLDDNPSLEELTSGKFIYDCTSYNYSNISYLYDGTDDDYVNTNVSRYFTDTSIDESKLLFSFDMYPIKGYNKIDTKKIDAFRLYAYPSYDFSKGYIPYADAQKLKDRKWLLFDTNGVYTEIETPKMRDVHSGELINYERVNGIGIF